MALHQINQHIWLGSYLSVSADQTLAKNNVTHILSVMDLAAIGQTEAKFAEHLKSKNYKHLYLDLQDTTEEPIIKVFPETNAFIEDAVSKNEGVLVHCIAGISRSTTCVCAYLMWKNKWTDEQALEYVKSKRSVANPNESFLEQLKVYYQCGYEVSPAKKPYREWLLKFQATEFHPGLEPSDISYTNADMPAMVLTWRHVAPHITKTPVLKVLVNGSPLAVTERVQSIQGQVEFVLQNNTKLPVSASDLQQVLDKLAVRKVALRCKNCSTTVASSGSFIAHVKGHEGQCQHFLLEPVEWMRHELEKGDLEGKLFCPNCNYKLGAYSWKGVKCSCGAWVAPSFRLQKSRVDEMASKQKPLL